MQLPASEVVRTKLLRLLYFVGAGAVCSVGINTWNDIQRKSAIQQQQQLNGPSVGNPSNSTENVKGLENESVVRICDEQVVLIMLMFIFVLFNGN